MIAYYKAFKGNLLVGYVYHFNGVLASRAAKRNWGDEVTRIEEMTPDEITRSLQFSLEDKLLEQEQGE